MTPGYIVVFALVLILAAMGFISGVHKNADAAAGFSLAAVFVGFIAFVSAVLP